MFKDSQLIEITINLQNQINAAKIKALNQVAREVYDKAVDLIASELGIQRNLITVGAGSGPALRLAPATASVPVAAIKATGRRLPLIDMGGRWSPGDRGASFVNRRGVRTVVPHSFIAQLGRGQGPSIYKRTGQKRFPVKKLLGTSVPAVFKQPTIQQPLRQFIRKQLPREFARRFTNA